MNAKKNSKIVAKIEMIRGKRAERRDHFSRNEIAQEILFKWKCRFLVSKNGKKNIRWNIREKPRDETDKIRRLDETWKMIELRGTRGAGQGRIVE